MNELTICAQRWPGCFLLACLLASGLPAGVLASEQDHYTLQYTVTPNPSAGTADVQLELGQQTPLLREMRMTADADIITQIEADGELRIDGAEVTWRPPADGGYLRWQVEISHKRSRNGYDALLTEDWGVFRAEDIIPRAATRTLAGAHSNTSLRFKLPGSWSAVTQYQEDNGEFKVRKPERRFDLPEGWIVIGKLGVRREQIAGTSVGVAAPVGETNRKLETLALLRWTLPELKRILPELPERLTIVSAGEPMWRGALSAPTSLFLHADRPLISENATSTLLHEVMHIATGLRSHEGYDWIVEGLAEYYSLELLQRSGTISRARYRAAKQQLSEWATSADALCKRSSKGATTALAVMVFTDLDNELRKLSKGTVTLDDLTSKLVTMQQRVDLNSLAAVAKELSGADIDLLRASRLPGCEQ